MNKASIKTLLAGAAAVALCMLAVSSATKAQDANSILNASLGAVGQAVVVTVSSPGAKDQEYHAHIPNDKYSPDGDNTALSLVEVTKRVNEAIDAAKKKKKSTTISIKVEVKAPKK
ncbi:MAG: hypothetical protein K2X81_13125 [Candidatus Obscuribacterales bacterium]|nr:hypothetical protein [Candidatus Obscuribacterales bacterium]